MKKERKAFFFSILLGLILILAGVFLPIPGGALTTSEYSNGKKTDYYVFDDKYSSIDEYVGGDAYNYIIGASLVAGKMSGAIASKAIFIAGGVVCLCLGVTLKALQKKDCIPEIAETSTNEAKPSPRETDA